MKKLYLTGMLGILVLPLNAEEKDDVILAQGQIVQALQGSDVDPCSQGQIDAQSTSTIGWTIGGCASGYLLGCLGAGACWLIANSSNPSPPSYRLSNISAQDQMAYIQCYQSAAKQKQASAALVGGAVGVGLLVVTILLFVPIE